MGCIDDNLAVDFASGSLSGAQAAVVERHLATCRDCRTLVATLAPAPGERDSEVATAPRRNGHGSGPGRPGHATEPVVALGDTIGRYVVLRRLGAGGMGVVFAAYDPQLDRKIALKLLRTGIGLGEREANARLVREAQAIARLNHPNVVAVYDVGTAGTDLYLAMEFVEGDTLSHWLKRWERPWPEIVAMFVEAGRGLAAAHAVGLLHRDFKPDNVLVGSDGRVRVSDFGLARSAVTDEDPRPVAAMSELRTVRATAPTEPLTGTGAVMGTPRYMAPEQLRGESVTAAADQFSFCVALYEALYGQHPLPGETAAEMNAGKARVLPPPPSSVVSPAIGAVLARGLDPQPARRFPSMAALLEQLVPPAPRPRPRRLAILLGAVAMVMAGAAAAMVLRPGSSEVDATLKELRDQVRQLEAENKGSRDMIDQMRRRAESDKINVEGTVRDFEAKIAERDREIAALNEKIAAAELEPDPVVAVRRPAAPPPPIERGLSPAELKAGVSPQVDDINGCWGEWSSRTGQQENSIKVTFKVYPEGRVAPRTEVTGLDDKALVECVEPAFQRMRFPVRDMTTLVAADVQFADGKTIVTPYRQGIEDPPPRIDSPGE
ncbi:MAG TPA: protein kinase [Kofleriaceae bacterium]|nr:protein kinase [Kofleriaceae bacterium]